MSRSEWIQSLVCMVLETLFFLNLFTLSLMYDDAKCVGLVLAFGLLSLKE